MGNLDLIILAMIAGFILLRLRSELGKKTGNEPEPPLQKRDERAGHSEPLTDLRHDRERETREDNDILDMEPDPALRRGYQDIRRMDRSFNPADFVQGAGAAYKMILEAFWSGDKATLKDFLDGDIYGQFSSAIDARESDGLTLENSLIAIRETKVNDARLHGSSAEVTVDFKADVLAVTRSADGTVVEGSVSDGVEYNDRWVFARNTKSDDPNWTLVATRAI